MASAMVDPLRAPELTTDFFGSALKNFGAGDLLDGFAVYTGNILTGDMPADLPVHSRFPTVLIVANVHLGLRLAVGRLATTSFASQPQMNNLYSFDI
jgi:hypothetical protein